MRVLFISGSYPPIKCGVGDYLYRLAHTVAEHAEFEVAVLTSSVAEQDDDRVELFATVDSWGINRLGNVLKVLRSWKPDIVHIQYPTLGYRIAPGYLCTLMSSLIPLVSFLSGYRVIQTWHEYELHRMATLPYFLLRALVPSDVIVVRPNFREHLSPFVQRLLRRKRIVNIRGASVVPKIELDEEERQQIRRCYLKQQQRLIVFFGFIFSHKGTDLVLDIADPQTDQVVIAGGYEEGDYLQRLKKRMSSAPWSGKADLVGFLSLSEVSALLTVADAVVLPYRGKGGGEWNSSLQAALSHRCFVVTTSTSRQGFDVERNVFYAEVDNIEQMRKALGSHFPSGWKPPSDFENDEWKHIADAHVHLYTENLRRS